MSWREFTWEASSGRNELLIMPHSQQKATRYEPGSFEHIFSCDQAAIWLVQSVCPSVSWEFRWSNKWNWYSSGLKASILVWHTCTGALSGWVLYRPLELTKLTRPDLHHVVSLFILRDVRQSLEIMRTEGSMNISPWFLGSLWFYHFGYVAWEWWEFRWSNKWNWYSSRLNASILVWHTCAGALSGWVLYRPLELIKLTRPDLHHVVGLFILRDVRLSVRLSVRHTFFTMFPSLYHHEIFRSHYHGQK